MLKERGLPLNTRVKFLEAFSNACEAISLPYPDCNYLFQDIHLLRDEKLSLWIQTIDESTFPLDAWLESLVYFQKWIQEQQKGKNFPDQIEYISCCIEGDVNSGRLMPLIDLLKYNLDQYGIL